MTVKAQFLGGAKEVGRLGMLLEHNDARLLFDYGLSPNKPVPSYPLEAPPVDLILLTHAHLDHSGMLPWVASRYETSILTTGISSEVASLLHRDSLKIATKEGFPPMYDKGDIRHTEKVFEHFQHAEWREAAGMELHFHSAGHIPGSTIFELRGDRRIAFTGDVHMTNTRLLWGAHPVKCDLLFLESTYAGREHTDRGETEKALIDAVDDTLKKGGTAVIPSFAVGRSQEMALVLKDRGYNVYLDGMAKDVAKIFLRYPEFLRNKKELARALERVKFITNQYMRKQAARPGNVILTTSGMLDGGPVLYYMRQLAKDPRSSVLMSGFQVEGCNGRRLLETGHLLIDGETVKVHCRVEKYDFSAHAGHQDLVRFAKESGAKDVVLFHGDQPEMLADDLGKFTNVHIPEIGQELVFRD